MTASSRQTRSFLPAGTYMEIPIDGGAILEIRPRVVVTSELLLDQFHPKVRLWAGLTGRHQSSNYIISAFPSPSGEPGEVIYDAKVNSITKTALLKLKHISTYKGQNPKFQLHLYFTETTLAVLHITDQNKLQADDLFFPIGEPFEGFTLTRNFKFTHQSLNQVDEFDPVYMHNTLDLSEIPDFV